MKQFYFMVLDGFENPPVEYLVRGKENLTKGEKKLKKQWKIKLKKNNNEY